MKLRILHKGFYYLFNQNGLIIPKLKTLPTIDITPK